MRIDLAHDRVDHQPKTYRDPVVAREGVFAQIEQSELSETEAQRIETAQKRDAKAAVPAKEWTPKTILDRITRLYARFVKPKGGQQ